MARNQGASPRRIGRYRIKRELGRGGMAAVYLAEDPSFGRDVALKVLPRARLHDEMFRARFEREAQTIAALEHPAIVPVHDFGEQDGQPYLVMRYMHGGSLEDRLKGGPLSPAASLQILKRIGPALDEAHRQGIVHRDLKPGNILFDRYGNAFLSDFGIVKVRQATANLTGNAMLGTPGYMSPEQVQGNAELDGRSDIYALGAILFRMLTGNQPYEAETPMGVALKHVTDPVPSLRTARPDLSPALEGVVAKAMAKDPHSRFATAGAMTSALEAAISRPAGRGKQAGEGWAPTILDAAEPSEPVSAGDATLPPDESGGRFPTWLWVVAALFLFGCMIGVIAAAGIVVFSPDGALIAGRAAATGTSTQTMTVTAAVAVAAASSTPSPSSTAATATVTATDEAMTTVTGESETPEATDTPTPHPATSTPTPSPTPSLTPAPIVRNGRIVFDAAEEEGIEIFIMDPDGSNLTRLTRNTARDDEADLSSDGRFIAFERQTGDDWTIFIMESNGDSPRELIPGRQPEWSPDDRYIAFESFTTPQQLFMIEVSSGDITQLTNTRNNSRAPSFSPDGSQVVFMTEVDDVWQLAILNVNNGLQRQITEGDRDKRFPVWSPDGDLIAFNTLTSTGGPDQIWTIEPDGDNPTQLTDEGQNGRPAWSPDGRFIIFNSNRSERWLIWRMERDGSDPVALTTIGPDQRPDWGRP